MLEDWMLCSITSCFFSLWPPGQGEEKKREEVAERAGERVRKRERERERVKEFLKDTEKE